MKIILSDQNFHTQPAEVLEGADRVVALIFLGGGYGSVDSVRSDNL